MVYRNSSLVYGFDERNKMNNREIKFRAWDKMDKVMRGVLWLGKYEVTLDDEERPIGAVGIIRSYKDLGDKRGKEAVLMQYTGLKDKNDKPVYEGDLIRATFGAWTEPEPDIIDGDLGYKDKVIKEEEDVIGEVRIRVIGGTGFIVRGGRLDGRFFNFNTNKPFEVIGNIFEDKHLLEEQNE